MPAAEMSTVSTAPPIRDVALSRRIRSQSSAPQKWAHSTPAPMVPPMMSALATSTMGEATLMPDSGRSPRNFPTTTASTMLYSC